MSGATTAERATPEGSGARRRGAGGRVFLACWLLAFGFHLAWVPNLLWFMVAGEASGQRSVVEITPVAIPPRPAAPPTDGQAGAGRRLPEIQLPGVAPGGSTAALALRRHEWTQPSRVQRASWAQRALDRAETTLSYRPAMPRQPRSPAAIIATLDPDDDDLRLDGVTSRDASLLRRRGERLTGEARREPGAGGVPSEGVRVPLGAGDHSTASAGDGVGPEPRSARRGARPRRARPAVTEAPASADARRSGPLAGLQPSRQAAATQGSSEPVREARRASGEAERARTVEGGQVRRRDGQGASQEVRGPGQGGRGRGSAGSGRSSNPLLDDYLRGVMARVNRHWSFPDGLALALHQGQVILGVRVRHDGRVEAITVQRSSGFPDFDANAIAAVRQANPLAPPPPEELFRHGGDSLVIPLSMRYRNPMFE